MRILAHFSLQPYLLQNRMLICQMSHASFCSLAVDQMAISSKQSNDSRCHLELETRPCTFLRCLLLERLDDFGNII